VNSRKSHYSYLFLATALALTACGGSAEPDAVETAVPPAEEATAPNLATVPASEFRSEADRARDAGRKPAEVIAVLGIEPGMNVLDVMAGGGWYTEVLSLAVGPDGHVTSHNTAFALQIRDGVNEKALVERIADGRLPNVTRLNKEVAELVPEDGPFDAAITALNLHDIYNRGGEEAAVGAMRGFYSILKPGGIFGLIDHQGLEGQDNAELHRMLKTDAIRVAEAAGFIVEEDSDVLHSDIDDMTQHMRTEGIRGFTNRFLLKLRKPE